MSQSKRKIQVGVMGSAGAFASPEEEARMIQIAEGLAKAICANDCILVSGATTGLPGLVATEVQKLGGLSIGISPAMDVKEHVEVYKKPLTDTALIYTGFGLKGRNVVNIRSSDIVIIFAGSIGTLNEFTIAYDEGKIIGVLEGTGGVADQVQNLVDTLKKSTKAQLVFNSEPGMLLSECLQLLK